MPKEEEDALQASLKRVRFLETENEQLKREIHHLSAQIAMLRAHDAEKRSMLRKKTQAFAGNTISSSAEKQMDLSSNTDDGLFCENSTSKLELLGSSAAARARTPRVPTPPPNPLSPPPSTKLSKESKSQLLPPPPPPPPPPLSSKSNGGSIKAVRRVPEVLELYRSLTRKEGKSDMKAGSLATPAATNAREMIGEIENRSAYLLAIKSDVETQSEFVSSLTREVESAAYKEIADVEAFVKWLDEELSYLVDERAVLKHFPKWPEKKADAMREAAVGYRELKNLEAEVFSFHDDRRQATSLSLKRMHALQEKLERSVQNNERVRESASKRYRDFKIPWQWMLDTGIIAQLKFGSLKLAKEFMSRVVTAVKFDAFSDDEELMLQGVRFAYRVHQILKTIERMRFIAFAHDSSQILSQDSECFLERNTSNIWEAFYWNHSIFSLKLMYDIGNNKLYSQVAANTSKA
ncbi:protein CHUP1, chloroplastic [Canna indica]|uniref:Protein CHUP1, chloroplastic n=1 Tax=Canna indica TaxID=4628 RepID=A0AAQ3KFB6_9LILI|nr:protein CHUP1, chloroplastic [Canna indica]